MRTTASPTASTPAATATAATLESTLPKGAVIEKTGGAGGDGWVVYRNAAGKARLRFRAPQARTLQSANPGRNNTTDNDAGVNTNGDAFVLEGRHRSIGAAKGDLITPDKGGVLNAHGVLDFKYNPMKLDEVGVAVKDLHIDYTVKDVSKAEADFLYFQKYGIKPSSSS